MAGRGPQTFKKRQKEQQRKERQQEKAAKRVQRKQEKLAAVEAGIDPNQDTDDYPELGDFGTDTEEEEPAAAKP